MSSSALPSFTAYYAHKRASRTAARLCANKSDPIPCGSCNGSKTTKLSIDTLGTDGKWTTETSTIPCIHCKDGLVNPFQQTYSALIWCRCKHKDTSHVIHAADGRRVFGNDTYLCSACGFVKQFG